MSHLPPPPLRRAGKGALSALRPCQYEDVGAGIHLLARSTASKTTCFREAELFDDAFQGKKEAPPHCMRSSSRKPCTLAAVDSGRAMTRGLTAHASEVHLSSSIASGWPFKGLGRFDDMIEYMLRLWVGDLAMVNARTSLICCYYPQLVFPQATLLFSRFFACRRLVWEHMLSRYCALMRAFDTSGSCPICCHGNSRPLELVSGYQDAGATKRPSDVWMLRRRSTGLCAVLERCCGVACGVTGFKGDGSKPCLAPAQ